MALTFINLFTFQTDILKLLDQSQYCRFNADTSARDLNEFNPATDLNNIRLLANYRTCLTYREYKEVKSTLIFIVSIDKIDRIID